MSTITRIRSTINPSQQPEEEQTLREKVNEIIDRRRRETLERVEKTIIYHAEMGGTQLHVDDLPGLHAADHKFVMKWLRSQGFKVVNPKFSTRAIIDLRAEEPEE